MSKLALIVGASSGVGEATARELAVRGYRVVLSARCRDRLAELVSQIGSAADCCACDAASAAGVQSLADFVRQRHGLPDVIVNCAGLGQWKRIEDTSPAEAHTMIGAPYLAAFNVSQAFMRDMLQRGSGLLIHVNSPACYMPWPSSVGYSAARFALRGLHEALSQDLAGTGVHSCHVVFGRIDSQYFDNNPGVLQRMPKISVLIRTLSSAECAKIIANLAERPRRQVVYPFMLRLFYWSSLTLPWLTRWLLRATAPKP
ncbi:MAG: SDR family oxidoreductase [Pirellulaceae bacterium]|nr:SDR family oxidoreductase [Pirellulaceae bacterium]